MPERGGSGPGKAGCHSSSAQASAVAHGATAVDQEAQGRGELLWPAV